jgi:hypothetical protein
MLDVHSFQPCLNLLPQRYAFGDGPILEIRGQPGSVTGLLMGRAIRRREGKTINAQFREEGGRGRGQAVVEPDVPERRPGQDALGNDVHIRPHPMGLQNGRRVIYEVAVAIVEGQDDCGTAAVQGGERRQSRHGELPFQKGHELAEHVRLEGWPERRLVRRHAM